MACVCNLDNVDAECGRNAPGLKTIIDLACVGDITSIGAATDHEVSTITPVTNKGFYMINILRKENDLKTTPNEDGGYNTEFKGFISKQAAAKANILTSLATDENYIGLIRDQNGVRYIIGSVDHPARLRVEATVTPKNGYTLTGLWEGHANLPLIFTGTVPRPT